MEKLVELAIANKAQQKPKEFCGLLETLNEMTSNKIAVEIGSYDGGCLHAYIKLFDKVISIDLENRSRLKEVDYIIVDRSAFKMRMSVSQSIHLSLTVSGPSHLFNIWFACRTRANTVGTQNGRPSVFGFGPSITSTPKQTMVCFETNHQTIVMNDFSSRSHRCWRYWRFKSV